MAQVQWLTDTERQAWLGLLMLISAVPATLDAQLQRDAGLTTFEYLVLAMISESPDRTVQLKSLARLTNGSQSRLSHVLTRLERRGFVRRAPSPDNGRVTLAVLTDTGWDKVRDTAPTHVATVRALVFDRLSAAQVRQLATISRLIAGPAQDVSAAAPERAGAAVRRRPSRPNG